MQTIPRSLQQRFEIVNGQLCLSVFATASAMARETEGELFKGALDYVKVALNYKREDRMTSWVHFTDEYDKRRVWIVYDTIAKGSKEKIDHYYGDVWHEARKEILVAMVEKLTDVEDATYFNLLGDYTPKQVGDMVQACAWLRLLNEYGFWEEIQQLKVQAFMTAAIVLKDLKLYGLKCGHYLSLMRKVKDWAKDGKAAVQSGKVNNCNATKGGEKQEIMYKRIMDLYASPLKPPVMKVAEIYNAEALENGWTPLTRQRIGQVLHQPRNEALWYPLRHGKNKERERSENILKRADLQYADEVWSWDGTTVQIYMNEDNKLNKPLYRVTIADGFSGAIIGEAFGETETADVCLEAFRLAVEFTGHFPSMIQMDGAIARMKKVQAALGMLNVMGIKAQPYNGKSKYVERVLGRKEQGVMRFYGNFTGGNATGKSLEAKANADHIKLLHKSNGLPTTRRGIMFQDLLATVIYNNKIIKKHGKTPLELYETADTRRKKASKINVALAFWKETDRMIIYDAKGLWLTVGSDTREYVVESESGIEDQAFRLEWFGARFRVRYHLDDMSNVMLFDADDKYVAMAVQKKEFAARPGHGEVGEGSTLRKALDQRSRFFQNNAKSMDDISSEVRANGNPKLDFMLAHKDEINRANLDVETLTVECLGTKPTAKQIKAARKSIGMTYTPTIDSDEDESIYQPDMDLVNSLL